MAAMAGNVMAATTEKDPAPMELMAAADAEMQRDYSFAAAEAEIDSPSHFWIKPNVKFTKYVVTSKKLQLRCGRELSSKPVESGPGILKRGAIVESDHESWAIQTPDLRLHVILPKAGGEAEGWYGGWCSFKGVMPLGDDGKPVEPPAVLTLEDAKTIQKHFERGFKQCAIQRAIKDVRAAHPGTADFRANVAATWMKVRGPAIARLGFPQSAAGWDAWHARPHEYDEGREGGRPMTKAENEGLMKNHNRIIKLMSGTDPASAGAEDDHGADGTPTTYAFAMPSFDF